MTLLERVVSLSQRRKRAQQMRLREPKLMRKRMQKKYRFAPNDVLIKRAQNLARKMFRMRVVGKEKGAHYRDLSPSEKINIDKMISSKAKLIKKLALRLIPVIRKAEMARLQTVKHSHSDMTKTKLPLYTTEETIEEKHVSNRERLRRSHSGQKRGHIRKAKGYVTPERYAKSSQKRRKLISKSREAILKRKFPGVKLSQLSSYQKEALQRMLTKQDTKNVKRLIKNLSGARIKRADWKRISKPKWNKYDIDMTGGQQLNADYEIETVALCLLEDHDERLNELLRLGLVDRDRLELYKRIMKDTKQSSKIQRYRDMILDIYDKFADIVLDNDAIYQRVRVEVQKKRFNEEGGAGEMGTKELLDKYRKMTPGQSKTVISEAEIDRRKKLRLPKDPKKEGPVPQKVVSKYKKALKKPESAADRIRREAETKRARNAAKDAWKKHAFKLKLDKNPKDEETKKALAKLEKETAPPALKPTSWDIETKKPKTTPLKPKKDTDRRQPPGARTKLKVGDDPMKDNHWNFESYIKHVSKDPDSFDKQIAKAYALKRHVEKINDIHNRETTRGGTTGIKFIDRIITKRKLKQAEKEHNALLQHIDGLAQKFKALKENVIFNISRQHFITEVMRRRKYVNLHKRRTKFARKIPSVSSSIRKSIKSVSSTANRTNKLAGEMKRRTEARRRLAQAKQKQQQAARKLSAAL